MKFFHTLREKEFVIKRLKRGNPIPFLRYSIYRLKLSHLFALHRKNYHMRVWYAPLAFWLWTRPDATKSDELFYESFLKKDDVVVDCGAHLGTLVMTASRLIGDTGKVIACEMHPRTFSYLSANVHDNHCANVELHNVAIGDEKKTVTITDEYVSDINHVSEGGKLAIPMVTIDSLTSSLSKIDLLKLDVEGYELQALRGAQETLHKTKAVYFEAAERNFARYGYSLKDIIVFLAEHGFTCFAFDEQGERFPIQASYIPPVKYENILALRN